jgi:hypothetical protein
MDGACSMHKAMIKAYRYKLLVEKLEGKRSRGRPGHRWEDNIKMNLMELGWECVSWIHLI